MSDTGFTPDSIYASAGDMAFPMGESATSSEQMLEPKVSTAVGKILHVVNGEHYSGAERVQDLLAMRLPELGYDVGIACVKPDLFPKTRRSTSPLYDIKMRWRFDLWQAKKLARIVKEEGYHLLHAHTPRSVMLARIAASLARRPLVFHVHSPTSKDTDKWLTNWLNNKIESFSLRRVNQMIAVSGSLGKHMQSLGFKEENITVVQNGVPVVEPVQMPSAPVDHFRLGVVALFRPRKGLEVMIDALALMKEQGLPVSLRAIGAFETPEYEAAIMQRVAERDVASLITWTGFCRNVNAELKQVDLFVLPSLFGEGLPMVVLEAMALGIPVAGTNVEGVPEAVRDGLEGVIAEPDDPEDLVTQIKRVISGEVNWNELSKNALARQVDNFSDLSMAKGVAKVYQRVLTQQPR